MKTYIELVQSYAASIGTSFNPFAPGAYAHALRHYHAGNPPYAVVTNLFPTPRY